MDLITPLVNCVTDVMNGTKCDGIELTTNLFKDHKMSINEQKSEKLQTFLRIRALEESLSKECFQVLDSNNLLVIPPKGSNAYKFKSDSEPKQYKFTKIFDQSVGQQSIYEFCGLPIVQRFLTGQNGLLFAYGITSSGKSYTMRGTTTNPGIIPRTLNTVFDVIGSKINKRVPNLKPNTFTECTFISDSEKEFEESLRTFIFEETDKTDYMKSMSSFRSQISIINENTNHSMLWNDVLHSTFRTDNFNTQCSIWITFYEIYNDSIHDLLDLEIIGEKKPKIMILRDEWDNYYVKGLRQICVTSAEEAYKVFLFGQKNLHISSTNLNKNSSRSHCTFNITLVTHRNHKSVIVNNLSICDLAGAERSEKANNTGERIREAGRINGSLLSLSRCISTIRHNQKFEHDPTRKRFVNFRDSKLTKVFQPFLSGSGSAAMISNLNPSPDLFDETLFALKFTGIASQIVVNNEDQKNRFHESIKRLTQVWMQSSERWSNFAHLKPPKPSVSIIQTIKEEDEEEGSDTEVVNVTFEEFEKKVNEITRMDLSRVDPQEIEVLKSQIDFLIEKLKQTENDKFEMEVEVRAQVVSEFDKLIKDMEEMAENKDRAKKKLEEMMTQRLLNTESMYKTEKQELEKKLNSMENDIFEVREELCREKENNEKTVENLNNILSQKVQQIIELESKLSHISANTSSIKLVTKDVNTSAIEFESNDANTSTIKLVAKDVNTSAIEFESNDANTSTIKLVTKDVNTSAIEFESNDANTSTIKSVTKDVNTSAIGLESNDANTSTIKSVTKDVNTSAIGLESNDANTSTIKLMTKDVNTSTIGLDNDSETISCEKCDKNTSFSIEYNNKSTFIERDCLHCYEDKDTVTECFIADKSIATDVTEVSTSPVNNFHGKYVLKENFDNLLIKLNKCENDLKDKESTHCQLIANNALILEQKDKRISELEEKIMRLNEQINSTTNTSSDKLYLNKILQQYKPLKTNFAVATTSEVIDSKTSGISTQEKLKKNAKYSTRKKRPNANNSMEKRYLSSVSDTLESTKIEEISLQTSVNSIESINDEIGNRLYSTKKRVRTNKRKQTNDINENEDFKDLNRAPESKRKRPPLTNLLCSPISPILPDRITRSKAKKSIQF